MGTQSLLNNLIFLSLLIVSIFYWASLVYSNLKILEKLGFYGNFFANFLIFTLLALRWVKFGYFPLSNLYESLMFLTWGTTFISLIVQKQSKIALIGSIASPVSLFISGFASLSLPESMQAPSPLVPALKSNWLMMHVTVMLLSYASLIIGSLLAIFFLVLSFGQAESVNLQGNSFGKVFSSVSSQDTAFYKAETVYRDKLFEGNYKSLLNQTNSEFVGLPLDNKSIQRLSLLESVDNVSYRTISFGFPLLTVGIIAGAVWANEAWGSYWSWDPKETWALITWLIFASYLHTRITKNLQGETPALIASLGFVVIWICYLGVNFLGKGLHTYGQI
jgi:cytochrome c-type biogenesis protein CcsB